jgi:chemotaxis protein methyltransferase CheR
MRKDFLERYFRKDGMVYSIDEKIQKMVSFRQLNLKDSFASLGKFDLILCRYVLIYFTDELKEQICTNFHGAMQPDGLLALGATEHLGTRRDFGKITIERSTFYYPRSSENETFRGEI